MRSEVDAWIQKELLDQQAEKINRGHRIAVISACIAAVIGILNIIAIFFK